MKPDEPRDVIPLPERPLPEDVPLRVIPRGTCRHGRVDINEELRRVTCRGCGETLDPIQCLLDFLHWWKLQRWQAEELAYGRMREALRERARQTARAQGRNRRLECGDFGGRRSDGQPCTAKVSWLRGGLCYQHRSSGVVDWVRAAEAREEPGPFAADGEPNPAQPCGEA